MNLIAPTFLAALALLVPVLIAFLVRRRRKVMRVPSTMVFRLGAKSVAKSKRIRDIRRLLALLACLLGVGALVFAAARPSGARGDLRVFVVDVSASMSGAPIAEARGWLEREVAAMGPNARVAIVTAGADATVALPPTPSGPLVEEAIKKLTPEKDVASMDEALALAEGLAAAGSQRGTANVIVISDQKIDAETSRSSSSNKPKLVLVGSKSDAKSDNLGVTSLYTRTAPDARDEEEREAVVTVATSSTVTRRARLVIRLANRVVRDRSIEVPASGDITERVGIRGPGKLVAKISPDDGKRDVLGLDDEASLEEITREPPRVLFVRPSPSGGAAAFFVERAIRASGVTDLTIVAPDDPSPPTKVDVAVVLAEGLARPRGVPTLYFGVEPAETGLKARSIDKKETHLRSVASEDSLLRGVAFDEMTTLRAKVATPPKGARSLVDFDGGSALIAGGAGNHAWVWVGIDPEASDLVLRVAFPVLVGNVLTQLGGTSQVVTAKTVPRSEVTLARSEALTTFDPAPAPKWRIPYSPALVIAMVGAFLLALEAYLTFRRKWAS